MLTLSSVEYYISDEILPDKAGFHLNSPVYENAEMAGFAVTLLGSVTHLLEKAVVVVV